jgi:Flp pilus assembly protein TadG
MVELALITPLLLFLLLAGMDYSRVFYASVVVSNCARNGALFASDPNVAGRSPYETLEEAVLADASDLSETLQITTLEGTDAQGYGWVEVKVVCPFQTVVSYPGIPTQVDISRSVRIRKVPEAEE